MSRLAALNIYRMRKALGMTQQELADAATRFGHRMDRFTVANIERGIHANGSSLRPITLDKAVALANALGVPLDRLLSTPTCETCHGAPPLGFACTECGVITPKEADDA